MGLDAYDKLPEGMTLYLRHNGWHFSKKMVEFAARQMKKEKAGKMVRIEMWGKEHVEEILDRHRIELGKLKGYDHVYVANMAQADFYESSLETEESLARYIKDVVDDTDQEDGFIFNRFYADCCHNGVPIPWEDML